MKCVSKSRGAARSTEAGTSPAFLWVSEQRINQREDRPQGHQVTVVMGGVHWRLIEREGKLTRISHATLTPALVKYECWVLSIEYWGGDGGDGVQQGSVW